MQEARNVSKLRSILLVGVLGWGLPTGVLANLLSLLADGSRSAAQVAITMLIFALGGVWFGRRHWRRSQRQLGHRAN